MGWTGRCVGSVIEPDEHCLSHVSLAKEDCTPSKPKQFDSTMRVYRVPDNRDERMRAYNEVGEYSKASLTRRVNFVPCDRPMGHDRERPRGGEGGNGDGEQERGSVVRAGSRVRNGVER